MLTKSKGHTRRLPTGKHLAKALRAIFRRQLREVWPVVRDTGNVPSLRHWLPTMVKTCKPLTEPIWVQGGRESYRRISRLLARGKSYYDHARKTVPRFEWWDAVWVNGVKTRKPPPSIGISWDVFNQLILRANDEAVFSFCSETLATSAYGITEALAKLREALGEGQEEGKSYAQLAKDVGEIFLSPMRADRIARTEVSRSSHGGQMLLAQEAEREGINLMLEWLSSADACSRCLAIDGKQVKPGEPFATGQNKNPAYSTVLHPPLHVF